VAAVTFRYSRVVIVPTDATPLRRRQLKRNPAQFLSPSADMSYPTKYTRQYDYVSYQNANPNRPLPAGQIHADFNQVARSTVETIDFLKTSLRFGAVGFDQLTDAVKASMVDATIVQEILDQIDVVDAAAAGASASATNAASSAADLAPRFYPVLSSPVPLDLPGWAVAATGAGAEPSA
jgi:hypothetical protein